MTRQESLLEFPVDFPIKVVGHARDGFAATVTTVVQAHAPDFDPAAIETRPSTGGKYLSVTVTIRAVSREQLDALYRDLSTHPEVVWVL